MRRPAFGAGGVLRRLLLNLPFGELAGRCKEFLADGLVDLDFGASLLTPKMESAIDPLQFQIPIRRLV
jgi:hypothetical protein